MMKLIIFLITSLLLISCVQSSENKESKQKLSYKKNSLKSKKTKIDKINSPVNIALMFINLYVDNCNKMNESIDVIEWSNSNKFITNSFKVGLKNIIEEAYTKDPELGLDFDPIFDGQDYPDEGFELEKFDNTTNYITVKGKNWNDFKLTIKVVLNNDKWLIDGCGIINIPNEKQSKR